MISGRRATRVCIVGGGFTGLAAAHALARAGTEVTLLEQDSALGGLAGSFEVGGQRLEKFYHHWFTNDRHIMRLVDDLGERDRVLLRPTTTGMYYASRFFRLSSPLDVLRFKPLALHDRIRLGLATLAVRRVKNWRTLESLTAEQWLTRLCGRAAYRIVWEPLLVGKFGPLASEISAVWFWNKLKLRGGSRGAGGGEQLAYYRGGFAALADAVAKSARAGGAKIKTGTSVKALEVSDGRVRAVLTDAGRIEADWIILTTPLPIAESLLAPHVPAAYAEQLRSIRHFANLCIVLELDRSLSGIYWLNVNDPSFPFVGVIEHTNFEPSATYDGRHIVYLSKYVAAESEFYSLSDADLFGVAAAALKRMFPAFAPEWVRTFYVWRAQHAQPIIVRNYDRLRPALQSPIENVLLATMAQVYPEDRGTNYAVRNGLEAAEELIRRIDQPA